MSEEQVASLESMPLTLTLTLTLALTLTLTLTLTQVASLESMPAFGVDPALDIDLTAQVPLTRCPAN